MDRLPIAVRQPIYDALGLDFSAEQRAFIESDGRFTVVIGGERGGKTFSMAADLLPHIIYLPETKRDSFFDTVTGKPLFNDKVDRARDPHFVLFGPNYAEPRKEFGLIEGWLRKLGMLAGGLNKPSKPQDGPWRMVTNLGVVVATWSMEDPASIRAIDVEGAGVCEAGKCPYSGVERIFGRVSGTKGFITYSGTMEESQQWYVDWALMGRRPNHLGLKTFSLPAYTNHHQFPLGINDPEILHLREIYSDDTFAMRVLAEPRPPRVRVLKELNEEHIKPAVIPKDAEIEVWVDPGYASAYAVLFVAIWDEYSVRPKRAATDWKPELLGKRFHVVDEIYEQGLITTDIIGMVKRHKLYPRIRKGVMDIAGKGHRDGGESALEIWQKNSRQIQWNMKLWRELPLIERIRSSAKQNRISVDPKCKGLIAEAGLGEPVFEGMHPWKYPTDRDGRVISERPIDKWNHSAKALGYGLLHHLGLVESLRRPKSFNRLRKNRGGLSR